MTAMIGHNSRQASGNWIAISRDMRDHPVVGFGRPVPPADPKRGAYSRAEAWLDLVMEARWKRQQENNKGKIIWIERGQLMAARRWLAERWNWTEKIVRGFLDALEKETMVGRKMGQSKGQSRGRFANIITICNYDIYQTIKELDEGLGGQWQGQEKASRGPVEGQTLNKETKESNLPRAHAREQDRVEVNCESMTLHFGGKQKRIPFSTIDLWAVNARMYDSERARGIVRGLMEGWVADGNLPDKPSDTLQRALRYAHIDDEVGQQRLKNERRRGERGEVGASNGTPESVRRAIEKSRAETKDLYLYDH